MIQVIKNAGENPPIKYNILTCKISYGTINIILHVIYYALKQHKVYMRLIRCFSK